MWSRFVWTFLATFGLGTVAIAGFIAIVDPYDSGHFGIRWLSGIVDEDPRTADASRGRDQRFDSPVIGNSHGQLLDPARLSAGSGRQFVQLTVPGTGPREQMTLLRWFFRHHAHVGAVLLVADSSWCSQDASLPIAHEFPFWLYAESGLDYAFHALRTQALSRGWRRILVAFGWRKPSDPAGYWDYEIGRVWAFAPAVPAQLKTADLSPRPPRLGFPAVQRLEALLGESGRRIPLIVVFPPVFVTELPAAGSAEAGLLAECKGAFARLSEGRGAFLDFTVDGEIARDSRNFMDATHYRANVARAMEARIVTALAAPAGSAQRPGTDNVRP